MCVRGHPWITAVAGRALWHPARKHTEAIAAASAPRHPIANASCVAWNPACMPVAFTVPCAHNQSYPAPLCGSVCTGRISPGCLRRWTCSAGRRSPEHTNNNNNNATVRRTQRSRIRQDYKIIGAQLIYFPWLLHSSLLSVWLSSFFNRLTADVDLLICWTRPFQIASSRVFTLRGLNRPQNQSYV